jgi:hypothetical protein
MKSKDRVSNVIASCYRLVNRFLPWHRLPKSFGIGNLIALRHDLRRWNLFDTTPFVTGAATSHCPFHKKDLQERRADGSYNDLQTPSMGSAKTPFGRNAPLDSISASPEPGLEKPSPRAISRLLMTRTQFIPATSLNLLAAAWIQFQIHDWFGHQQEDQATAPIELAEGDTWRENPMKVRRTKEAPRVAGGCPAKVPIFFNTEIHWWDGSQLYGSNAERQDKVRSHEKGTLKVSQQGRLPSMGTIDRKFSGIDLTGFNDNYWIGLSLFHTVFALEHNAICAALSSQYPSWTDEQLFQKSRLINAALMAKIHTVEWTPALLQHPTLGSGMKANWWGLLGEQIRKRIGRLSDSEVLSGIPGSPTDHHGAPYSMTEEFVSVYRLHPLIPDDYRFYSLTDSAVSRYKSFLDIEGNKTRSTIDDLGIENVWFSFGVAHPGKLTLGNFPRFLQKFRRITPLPNGDPEILDVAAIDIFRDRERGVPRYNAFRRMLRMKPIKSFEELNPEWAKKLNDLYGGDIERLDLMVGLYAEEPPPGFAISDTAFRIFTLMAPRRLKSDRFFTADFRPEVYTPLGIEWVQNNDFTSVLLRHYPSLAPALRGVGNAFLPWHNVHEPTSY